MTTNHGAVRGAVKLVDHGPDDEQWNLVVLGDGFTADELPDFAAVVDGFIAHAQALFSYGDWDRINVYRIDVESNESGADSPNCDGTEVATYFDATFCEDGVTNFLVGNPETVNDVADQEVPEHDALLVFVNSSVYGAAADADVGWISVHPYGMYESAMHELGHAGFDLADEYAHCDDDRDHYLWNEPGEVNITVATDLASLKWASHVAPGTPIPTTRNVDCDECDPQLSPIADGAIGLFEGADTFRCDVFRPAFTCRMRDSSEPWCYVCVSEVRSILFWDDVTDCAVEVSYLGDPRGEDVETLRVWRDRTASGRSATAGAVQVLDRAYQKVSPSLAPLVRTHPWLAAALRGVLAPVARRLRQRAGADGLG